MLYLFFFFFNKKENKIECLNTYIFFLSKPFLDCIESLKINVNLAV